MTPGSKALPADTEATAVKASSPHLSKPASTSQDTWASAQTAGQLELDRLARGITYRLQVPLIEDGAGRSVAVPVVVVRGAQSGPTLGVTAVVHGNELNGLPVVQRLVRDVDEAQLRGTLVTVPVVNIPGYLLNQREVRDGQDLNRLMPGKPEGNEAEVYAHRFVNRVMRCFDYLIDLHTASFGRANSLYVRADMKQEPTATLARLIGPQIIVHNEGVDGTLRDAAARMGIHAITVEVGDPNRFQRAMIRSSRAGIHAVLDHLGMLPRAATESVDTEDEACVECSRSYWLHTHRGGVLEVYPKLADEVRQGEKVACLRNLFGDLVHEYTAPETGVVVATSTNPVAHAGARILHLGVVA